MIVRTTNGRCSVEQIGSVGIEGLGALHASLALQPRGLPVRQLSAHKGRRVLPRALHRSGHTCRQKEVLELLCLGWREHHRGGGWKRGAQNSNTQRLGHWCGQGAKHLWACEKDIPEEERGVGDTGRRGCVAVAAAEMSGCDRQHCCNCAVIKLADIVVGVESKKLRLKGWGRKKAHTPSSQLLLFMHKRLVVGNGVLQLFNELLL